MATYITVMTGGYGRVDLNLDQVLYLYADENGKAVAVFRGSKLVTSESLVALSERLPGPALEPAAQ